MAQWAILMMKIDKEMIVRKKYPIFLFLVFINTYFVFIDLVDGDWTSIENSLLNLRTFFSESLWPPNWKVLEARSYPTCQKSCPDISHYLDYVELMRFTGPWALGPCGHVFSHKTSKCLSSI